MIGETVWDNIPTDFLESVLSTRRFINSPSIVPLISHSLIQTLSSNNFHVSSLINHLLNGYYIFQIDRSITRARCSSILIISPFVYNLKHIFKIFEIFRIRLSFSIQSWRVFRSSTRNCYSQRVFLFTRGSTSQEEGSGGLLSSVSLQCLPPKNGIEALKRLWPGILSSFEGI